MILNNCKCGNEVKIFKNGFNAYIKCNICGNLRGGFSNREILIKVWNKENNQLKSDI